VQEAFKITKVLVLESPIFLGKFIYKKGSTFQMFQTISKFRNIMETKRHSVLTETVFQKNNFSSFTKMGNSSFMVKCFKIRIA